MLRFCLGKVSLVLSKSSTFAALLLGALLFVFPASSTQAETRTVTTGDDIAETIRLGSGHDYFEIDGGRVNRAVRLGRGIDVFEMSGGTIGRSVRLGAGDDEFEMSGGTIGGSIRFGWGADRATFSEADSAITIGGHIGMGKGDDRLTIEDGCYGGYDGGRKTKADFYQADMHCGSGAPRRALAYGGKGADTFILKGGMIGFITGATGNGNRHDKDIIIYRGGEIISNIDLGDGADELAINAAAPDIGGYIFMGAGDDRIEIGGGAWEGYHSGDGDDDDGVCRIRRDDDCIYGGSGTDSIAISGTTSFRSFINKDSEATIAGNVVMTGGHDYFESNVVPSGHVDMGGDSDDTVIRGGIWAGYHGGSGNNNNGNCRANKKTSGCIYGGGGGGMSTDLAALTLSSTAAIEGSIIGSDSPVRHAITISSAAASGGTERAVSGYINAGQGSDTIVIATGTWVGYHGVTGEGGTECPSKTPGCIYGGSGAGYDSFALSEVGGIDSPPPPAVITGNIIGKDRSGASNVDYIFILSSGDALADDDTTPINRAVRGYIDLRDGADWVDIGAGEWEGYHGGDGGGTACPTTKTPGCIYGGEGDDVLRLYGEDTVIGPVIGGDYSDNGTPDDSDDDELGIDYIVLIGGTLDYVDGGSGTNIVRFLSNFGAAGSGMEVEFAGDCDGNSGNGNQWVCGGDDTDRIEYSPDITTVITTNQVDDGIDGHCVVVPMANNGNAFSLGAVNACVGGVAEPIGTAPRTSSFAFGIEQVSVSPELQLWGGLSSAMQGFGRAMMEDFTSSSAHLTRPFDFTRSARFAQGDNKKDVIPSGAEESGNGRTAHLFTPQTHSNGAFHARQAQLRGTTTTALSLQGVSGATGSSSYQHDVNLIQHGFSASSADFIAQGGFHLMQGGLTSSDSADQFAIEGYGAGMKLGYGMADLAMLGAWFNLSSDDWGRPMAFSGTQWIVSAGFERELTFGATKLIPQARGFWQKTSIEEQGAISFSDEMVFTGKAGIALETGTHAFDLFFTRDDEASSLDTGLVQNHRMEEAIEAGWRSYSLADGFSLMGEVRYRHGLETGADSYSAGVAAGLSF